MPKESYFAKLQPQTDPLWKDKRPLLTRLDMELTERCNNNCIHCYNNLPVDDVRAKEKELSTGKIKEILDETASLGCLTVRFTGGEPLLREDFEELYIYARRLGLKVMVFTNATLLTPRVAELFTRIPPLEMIEVTVYGMKKKSYEAVTRNRDSFNAAWQGIKLLQENKVPFVVKSAILPPNKAELSEFEAWASTLPQMHSPPSYAMSFDLRCHRDSEEKNCLIKELRLSPEEILEVLLRKKDAYVKETMDFCSRFLKPPGDGLFICGAGIDGGCVDAYGHLQPCMMLRHPATIYDLQNGSLKDGFENFFTSMRQMKAVNSDYLKRCARCFLKSLCEQCPAKSWMEYGTLDTPVGYFCDIAHTQARYLGLLRSNEWAWEIRDWPQRLRAFSGCWKASDGKEENLAKT